MLRHDIPVQRLLEELLVNKHCRLALRYSERVVQGDQALDNEKAIKIFEQVRNAKTAS